LLRNFKKKNVENWKDKSLEESLREACNVYVRWGEEKQKQKAKIMLSTLGKPLERKTLLKERSTTLTPKKPQKGEQDSQTPGERKNQNISDVNVLKGKREDNSPYDL
jgi:hypothetical protein